MSRIHEDFVKEAEDFVKRFPTCAPHVRDLAELVHNIYGQGLKAGYKGGYQEADSRQRYPQEMGQ